MTPVPSHLTRSARLPADIHEEIMRVSMERGITFADAVRVWAGELADMEPPRRKVQPKEQTVNESPTAQTPAPVQDLPPSPAVDSALATAQSQVPSNLPVLGAEFLRIGLELGAKLADLEARDAAHEASVKALAVGLSNHLDQHDQGDIDPQATRDLILKVITEANLKGNALEAVRELWSALPAPSSSTAQLPAEAKARPEEAAL